jgi:hypothetical protein
VLGTFGKVILFFCPMPISNENNININQQHQDSIKSSSIKNSFQKFRYDFKREISFKHSIMGLCVGCLSNNSALDLVVCTLNGVSIWQYEPDRLADLINQKFEENEQRYLENINKKISNYNK